ncbi:hypothetical protein I6I68_03400 [Corynebacterium glucuronolyticum]|uniref:hypothetical protein n=1 Tax=Corynebacterium glucuronolyticum TaxID=39791 RepID=UPI00191D6775|nr:hypothetical protein [Corynebacterium glucuronolyticum]QQU89034.1 hypothetical protein I6I68_03400 [Corynebacterium glucuronolyticum]
MAHKKALAALTAAALAVTGAVVVPAPALAAYAKQGTDKHVEDVFWLDLAGVTGPDGRIIPGKEATVPGLEGYTVKVKVGDEQSPIATDKKAAAFDIDGVSTLVSADKEATQKITVTLTKDGKPEPLTLVVPDLNGQKVKVTTSAEDWKGLALEVAPDRLGHKDFSTITRSGSTDVPLVRTDNKGNSTTLTLELGAGEQKAMVGILKKRPAPAEPSATQPTPDKAAAAEDLGNSIMAFSTAVGEIGALADRAAAPSTETSGSTPAPSATTTSETTTASTESNTPNTTARAAAPKADAESSPVTPTTETATETKPETATENATKPKADEPAAETKPGADNEFATKPKTDEPATEVKPGTGTESDGKPQPKDPVIPEGNPNNPKPDGDSGSAGTQGDSGSDAEPGMTVPDPQKPGDHSSNGSSGSVDTDAIIGSVIGVLTVGGLGAGLLGGAVDKVLSPASPSKGKSDAANQKSQQQQKKPKITVKQPNGESLTLAQMRNRNSKSATTTKAASLGGKPKVSTKAKSKTSTRMAQQKKPRISVGKKSTTKKAASSSKKKTSKKKLADTGAPIGLPVGLASLLIMSGIVLLGVRQRRGQI